jgi:amphi-Trp domain-containing protein
MRANKNNFRHESLQDRKTIQGMLKSIARGIAKGKLTFSDEDGATVMHPDGLLHLKVTAEEDDNRHRLNVRITWHTQQKELKKKSLTVD